MKRRNARRLLLKTYKRPFRRQIFTNIVSIFSTLSNNFSNCSLCQFFLRTYTYVLMSQGKLTWLLTSVIVVLSILHQIIKNKASSNDRCWIIQLRISQAGNPSNTCLTFSVSFRTVHYCFLFFLFISLLLQLSCPLPNNSKLNPTFVRSFGDPNKKFQCRRPTICCAIFRNVQLLSTFFLLQTQQH